MLCSCASGYDLGDDGKSCVSAGRRGAGWAPGGARGLETDPLFL